MFGYVEMLFYALGENMMTFSLFGVKGQRGDEGDGFPSILLVHVFYWLSSYQLVKDNGI